MGTRSNIIIKKTNDYGEKNPNTGTKYIQLYRHWDGYITETGLDICQLFMKADFSDTDSILSLNYFLKDNLTHKYEIESLGNDCLPHGDVEYIYLVDLDDGIKVTAFIRGDYMTSDVDDWENWESRLLMQIDIIEFNKEQYHQLKSLNISG